MISGFFRILGTTLFFEPNKKCLSCKLLNRKNCTNIYNTFEVGQKEISKFQFFLSLNYVNILIHGLFYSVMFFINLETNYSCFLKCQRDFSISTKLEGENRFVAYYKNWITSLLLKFSSLSHINLDINSQQYKLLLSIATS